MTATLIFLLLAQVSWAGPFQQKGLFDFMLEDEASGLDYEEAPVPPESKPRFTPDDFDMLLPEPVCPFRCQCHLRVVQCSDLELGTNPLKSSGIESGAFQDMSKLSYLRIADTNITTIPKGLPSSLTELHLDGNKITKVGASDLKGLINLAKLGLSFNSISVVDNGTLANVPHLRELHLDNNKLIRVPGGLADHKFLQVIYLHNNNITSVGRYDFCPPGYDIKKASYAGVSLFRNPMQRWNISRDAFRCVYMRSAIQFGNYK
ncbi:decorin isoform X2 [Ochotona curzoniae]|uniref:decorin isoform X2 n=1 Tax=Ochotona curzoniae TaxID=130825 RepID=UPI001B34F9B8|nr:decorin isoform X2 [Ochotona curzoniae]